MTSMSKWKIAAVVTSLSLAVSAVKLQSNPAPVPTAPPTLKAAPAWELQDLDGKPVKSTDFKGKVVILDFWATWCPPCREEIPGFVKLQKKYEAQGLVIVGIALDDGGAATVKKFAQKSGINYPVLMGNDRVSQAFGGIEALPTTFILDREGKIAGRHIGLTKAEEFEKEIKPLLK